MRAPAHTPELRQTLAAPRIVVERLSPCVDGGRLPVEVVVGQPVAVEADIFMDGHEVLAAQLLWRVGEGAWQRVPMRLLGNDRWQAAVLPVAIGLHRYTVEAWHDTWGDFRSELGKKHEAGVPTQLDVRAGIELVKSAARQRGADAGGETRGVRHGRRALAAARRRDGIDDAARRRARFPHSPCPRFTRSAARTARTARDATTACAPGRKIPAAGTRSVPTKGARCSASGAWRR